MNRKIEKVGIFLGATPCSGGAFQYTLSILDGLKDSGYEVYCAFYKQEWNEYLKNNYPNYKKIDLAGMALVERLIGGMVRFLCNYLPVEMSRFVRLRCDPSIVRMSMVETICWIFPAQDRLCYESGLKPVIGVVYDLMHRYESKFPEVSGNGEYRKRETHYKKLCKYADIVLVDSNLGKRQLVESYSEARENDVEVLPFVPPRYIYEKNTESLSKFELPEEYIFYPAQFWQHKNHINLIKAFRVLKKKHGNLCLVLSGKENDLSENLKKIIRAYGLEKDIYLLGYLRNSQITEVYKKAKVMVMPTYFGPTNIPPLEAMALGCPVAVSDIYGHREQLGGAAVYFDQTKVKDIVLKVDKLLSDERYRQEMIVLGYKKMKSWNYQEFSYRLKKVVSKFSSR